MRNSVQTDVMKCLETLPEDMQRVVLRFAQDLGGHGQPGGPGQRLLQFAHAIPAEDLALMNHAIQTECERIEPDEWEVCS